MPDRRHRHGDMRAATRLTRGISCYMRITSRVNLTRLLLLLLLLLMLMMMMIMSTPQRHLSAPGQCVHSPQRHTVAGATAPTTTDTGKIVPQHADPTQTAYAHSREGAQAQGQRVLPLGSTRTTYHDTPSLRHFGLYKILLLPILYGVWHTHGRSKGGSYTAQ